VGIEWGKWGRGASLMINFNIKKKIKKSVKNTQNIIYIIYRKV
jgi:hypothetical protein